MLGGRGAGKTRAGAEWIRHLVEGPTPLKAGACRHIALVGETVLAVREVMIEGPSGLCAIAPTETRPAYIASRQLLNWPNGATAQIFSACHPDKLRGPQFDAAWCDELAKWRHDEECWDMLQFGLRLGKHPRQVVTTTPRPTHLIKRLMKDENCIVTRVSTMANKANLAPGFVDSLLKRYAGTPLGRQEIEAEIVETTPQAGDHYVIGANPTGLWQGKASQMAHYVDGAWEFLTPQNGWRVWDQRDKILRLYDGGKWLNLAPQFSPQIGFVTTSLDHVITPGSYNDTALQILDRDLVLGVGARVMAALPNNQSWKLGVADDVGRYGAHIPGGAQATNIGMTSHPMTYYAATPLRISGQDKALTSGTIRLQLHVLRLTPPAL